MIKEKKLKFYADKQGEYSNKLCCYNCKDNKEAIRIIKYYKKNKNTFRSMWYDDEKVSKIWIDSID